VPLSFGPSKLPVPNRAMRRLPYGVLPRLKTSTSRAIVNRNSVLMSGMEALVVELIGIRR